LNRARGKPGRWVDYSNTVNGVTEGLAVFSHTDNPPPHKWLTRNYGCFGPRRIGVLVHTGGVTTGTVAEPYHQYIQGKL
jgi:hypothetical protein